MKSIL
jgi:hypothetical protein